MSLYDKIKNYTPYNEQEEKDKILLLAAMDKYDDIFLRENTICHMTTSAWVLNKEHTKVLMAYHNIYDSWAWLGGHADGEEDLLSVAIREVQEESGIENVVAPTDDILSIEVLTVDGHIKKGEYVSSHLHLNVTFLLEADDSQSLCVNKNENSAVAWLTFDEVMEKSSEQWFKDNIYSKLIEKTA